MKKYLPYIIVVLILLIGSVFFLKTHQPGKNILPVSLNLDISHPSSKNDDTDSNTKSQFQNYGPAPEFSGIAKWLNSDPIKMADLRGKTVLVYFWTYSDINSLKSTPYITKWADSYKDKGLVVIGVHTPEFAFEKVGANVENAVKADHITFPIAQDNDYKTWISYKNQFWPTEYLIDKDGNIVYTHFGEGAYDTTEKALRTVLGLEGEYTPPQPAVTNQANSPQMYFGTARQENFGNVEKPSGDEQIYSFPKTLGDNKFAIEGNWQFTQEAAIHTKGFGRIKLNFDAAKVFLVAQSNEPTTIRIYVDGTLIKGVVITDSQLYQLYDSLAGGKHTMEIEVPDAGFQAFTFTFG